MLVLIFGIGSFVIIIAIITPCVFRFAKKPKNQIHLEPRTIPSKIKGSQNIDSRKDVEIYDLKIKPSNGHPISIISHDSFDNETDFESNTTGSPLYHNLNAGDILDDNEVSLQHYSEINPDISSPGISNWDKKFAVVKPSRRPRKRLNDQEIAPISEISESSHLYTSIPRVKLDDQEILIERDSFQSDHTFSYHTYVPISEISESLSMYASIKDRSLNDTYAAISEISDASIYDRISDASFNETFDLDSIRSGVYTKILNKKKKGRQVISNPPESIWMTIQRKDQLPQGDQTTVSTKMSGIESDYYENVQNLNLDKVSLDFSSIGTGVYSKIDKTKKKERPSVYSLPPENLDDMYAKINKSSRSILGK